MDEPNTNRSGVLVFFILFFGILAAILTFQKTIVETFIGALFSNYELIGDVLPVEWIVMNRDFSSSDASVMRKEQLQEIFRGIRNGEFNTQDRMANTLLGKQSLRLFVMESDRTLYFLNPYVAFMPIYLFIAGVSAFLFSMFFPATSNLSWIRQKLLRVYQQMESLLKKQFESHEMKFEPILLLTERQREDVIRQSTLPEVVISEVSDFVDIRNWIQGRSSNPVIPLKYYFRYRISTAYGNLIQGFVSGGAAILIFVIGLRGLKLIPAEEPSLILMALSIEFILLIVLMFTFAGSAQEERLDRVVKELEAEQREAIKQQTDALHQLFEKGSTRGDDASTVDSLADYEEKKILDELLSLMIREAEKKRPHGS